MKITVIGSVKVGLVSGIFFSELINTVICFNIDQFEPALLIY